MERREFLTTAATTAAALALSATNSPAQQQPKSPASPADLATRQLPELRVYHFATPLKQHAYEEFLAQTAIDAWNRASIEPVGVFRLFAKDNPTLKLEADSTDLYVLLPHKSVGSMLQPYERVKLSSL